MSRIPYPEANPATPKLGGRPTLNVERMLQHLAPNINETFSALGSALLWKGRLDPALREIAIVRVGYLSRSKYEVHHHESFARHVGVTEQTLKALCEGSTGQPLDPKEAAVIKVVDELFSDARPSDSSLSRVREYLADSELGELVVVVGFYMMVCRFLETTGVEIEEFTLDPSVPAD